MRVLVVGAGGVGSSAALIAARRDFFESWVVADYDLGRAEELVARIGDPRFTAARIDAGDAHAVAELCRANGTTHVLNAVDPRYVLSIFQGAFLAGAHYMDTAMSLSSKHPEKPYELPGVMLGDEQFVHHDQWVASGQLALVGMGVEPGLIDVFARYASDELFSEIDELGVRDASNLEVTGYEFAPSFSIWTVIEECLNPPADLGEGPRVLHHRAVQRARGVRLPRGDRPGRVRQRGARGGRAHAACPRRQAGDLQVRTRG